MSVFDKLTDASNYTGTTRQRHGMQAKGGRRTKNRRPITPLHKGRSEPQLSVKTDSRSPGRSRAESASVESTSYRPAGLVGGAFDTANVPFSGEDQRHAHVDEAVTRIYDSIHSREDALWLFRRMDRDNSGTLDVRELQKALNVHIGVKMDLPRCQMVLEALDTDADGRITVDDFLFGHKLARLGLVRQKFRATSYAVGRQDWGKLFRRYDRDNSGVLEFEEFRRAIRKDAKLARGEVSDDELLELFEFIDSDNNGSIDLDEFAKMLSIEPATPRRRGKVEGDSDIVEFTLQRICAELDRTMGTAQHMFHIADADGSGYLDASELDMVLRRRVGLQLTRKELQQLIAALDRDGNGNVSIQEFVMRLRKVRRENAAPIPYDKPKSPPPRKIAQNTDMEKLTQQLTVEQMTRMLMGGSDIKATKLAEYSWGAGAPQRVKSTSSRVVSFAGSVEEEHDPSEANARREEAKQWVEAMRAQARERNHARVGKENKTTRPPSQSPARVSSRTLKLTPVRPHRSHSNFRPRAVSAVSSTALEVTAPGIIGPVSARNNSGAAEAEMDTEGPPRGGISIVQDDTDATDAEAMSVGERLRKARETAAMHAAAARAKFREAGVAENLEYGSDDQEHEPPGSESDLVPEIAATQHTELPPLETAAIQHTELPSPKTAAVQASEAKVKEAERRAAEAEQKAAQNAQRIEELEELAEYLAASRENGRNLGRDQGENIGDREQPPLVTVVSAQPAPDDLFSRALDQDGSGTAASMSPAMQRFAERGRRQRGYPVEQPAPPAQQSPLEAGVCSLPQPPPPASPSPRQRLFNATQQKVVAAAHEQERCAAATRLQALYRGYYARRALILEEEQLLIELERLQAQQDTHVVDQLFENLDADGDAEITREGMRASFGDAVQPPPSQSPDFDAVGELFQALDRDGDGVVTREEMRASFESMAPPAPPAPALPAPPALDPAQAEMVFELGQLKIRELRKRALALGLENDLIDDALDSDFPKAGLIELLMAQTVELELEDGGRGDGAEIEQEQQVLDRALAEYEARNQQQTDIVERALGAQAARRQRLAVASQSRNAYDEYETLVADADAVDKKESKRQDLLVAARRTVSNHRNVQETAEVERQRLEEEQLVAEARVAAAEAELQRLEQERLTDGAHAAAAAAEERLMEEAHVAAAEAERQRSEQERLVDETRAAAAEAKKRLVEEPRIAAAEVERQRLEEERLPDEATSALAENQNPVLEEKNSEKAWSHAQSPREYLSPEARAPAGSESPKLAEIKDIAYRLGSSLGVRPAFDSDSEGELDSKGADRQQQSMEERAPSAPPTSAQTTAAGLLFDMLDRDGNGSISRTELFAALATGAIDPNQVTRTEPVRTEPTPSASLGAEPVAVVDNSMAKWAEKQQKRREAAEQEKEVQQKRRDDEETARVARQAKREQERAAFLELSLQKQQQETQREETAEDRLKSALRELESRHSGWFTDSAGVLVQDAQMTLPAPDRPPSGFDEYTSISFNANARAVAAAAEVVMAPAPAPTPMSAEAPIGEILSFEELQERYSKERDPVPTPIAHELGASEPAKFFHTEYSSASIGASAPDSAATAVKLEGVATSLPDMTSPAVDDSANAAGEYSVGEAVETQWRGEWRHGQVTRWDATLRRVVVKYEDGTHGSLLLSLEGHKIRRAVAVGTATDEEQSAAPMQASGAPDAAGLLFDRLDKDGDGNISRAELFGALGGGERSAPTDSRTAKETEAGSGAATVRSSTANPFSTIESALLKSSSPNAPSELVSGDQSHGNEGDAVPVVSSLFARSGAVSGAESSPLPPPPPPPPPPPAEKCESLFRPLTRAEATSESPHVGSALGPPIGAPRDNDGGRGISSAEVSVLESASSGKGGRSAATATAPEEAQELSLKPWSSKHRPHSPARARQAGSVARGNAVEWRMRGKGVEQAERDLEGVQAQDPAAAPHEELEEKPPPEVTPEEQSDAPAPSPAPRGSSALKERAARLSSMRSSSSARRSSRAGGGVKSSTSERPALRATRVSGASAERDMGTAEGRVETGEVAAASSRLNLFERSRASGITATAVDYAELHLGFGDNSEPPPATDGGEGSGDEPPSPPGCSSPPSPLSARADEATPDVAPVAAAADLLFDMLDKDGDGSISRAEFAVLGSASGSAAATVKAAAVDDVAEGRGKALESWSILDVGAWLVELKMGQYVELLRAAGVGGPWLARMTDAELERLGVERAFHRGRMLSQIKRLLRS